MTSHHFCLVSTGLMSVMLNLLSSAGSTTSPTVVMFLDLVRTRCQGFCWWCITLQHHISTLLSWQKHYINQVCNPAPLTLWMFRVGRLCYVHWQCDTPGTQICLVITPSDCLVGSPLSLFLSAAFFLLSISCDTFKQRNKALNHLEIVRNVCISVR